MKWWLLVLVAIAGCDQTWGLSEVPLPADGARTDAMDATMGDGAPGTPLWKSFAVGTQHGCGLDRTGHLACMGMNAAGGNTATPTRMGTDGVVWSAVSSGRGHSCAISGGVVSCWGSDEGGKSTGGGGDGPDVIAPQGVPAQGSFTAVAAGGFHTCAIDTSEKITCWGNSQQTGAIGEGIHPMAGQFFMSLSAGYDHTCAIDRDHDLWCWGGNTHGQVTGMPCNLSDPTNPANPCTVAQPMYINLAVTSFIVSAGNQTTCIVTGAGDVYCQGDGTALGTPGFDQPMTKFIASGVWVGMSAGGDVNCPLSNDGNAYCWGDVTAGGLGDGKLTENVPAGAQAVGIPAQMITVSPDGTGAESACALNAGKVSCWGNGAATPTLIADPPG